MSSAPAVVCVGDILVDMIATPSGRGLEGADAFHPKPGGATANVSVGLARLGVPTAFVGKVGDDAFGSLLRHTLERERVDVRSLATSRTQPTTLAFVSLDPEGRPSFAFYRHPGADLQLRAEEIDASLFDEAKAFHFSSLALCANPAAAAVMCCVEQARRRGLFVSYDPNWRPALWPNEDVGREAMLAPLRDVDFLKVSEEELALLAGEVDWREGCARLAGRGPKLIAVTRGERGMAGWARGEWFEIDAFPTTVVDTTGCGDASVAGALAALLDGAGDGPLRAEAIDAKRLRAALEFANRCAAFAASAAGAIPSLPRRADIA